MSFNYMSDEWGLLSSVVVQIIQQYSSAWNNFAWKIQLHIFGGDSSHVAGKPEQPWNVVFIINGLKSK